MNNLIYCILYPLYHDHLRTIAILLTTFVLSSYSLSSLANAEAQWQRGFNIQMPATSRSIKLAQGVDAKQWARRQGLQNYQVENLGNKGSVVNVPMEEREWLSKKPTLCNTNGVQSCENTQCQHIQLEGRVRSGPGIQSFKPRLRLVKKAPDVEQLLSPTAYNDSTNTTDFQLNALMLKRPPKSANYQLNSDQLPEDTQNWNLVVESACSKTVTPLESLVPARDNKRVLVLLSSSGKNSAQAIAGRFGLKILRKTELKALNEILVELEISEPASIETMLPQLQAEGGITGAFPEHFFSTSAEYSDPYSALAYGPKKIGATNLHANTTGKGNLIAVIDTGLDEKHPELVESIAETHDLTGKGWTADLHGTAIAGIIAAKANNGLGSYGVAPGVKILALKACQPKQSGKLGARCRTSTLVQALDLAIQKNAKIINMSLGGPPDKLVARYVQAANQKNLIVIAAAGNGGAHAKPAFPAALDEVIAVTAVDALDNAYRQATTGEFIELAAPGVDIISVSPGQDYPVLSGTSMATAHVSGAVALILELTPSAQPDALRKALSDYATDLGEPGPDAQFGVGVIDICKAANALTETTASCDGG